MKTVSLLKLIQNEDERDPSVIGSEAYSFLTILKDEDGWGVSEKAWKTIFTDYSKKAQQEFIQELLDGGWIEEEMVNHLDTEMKLTEKAEALLQD